MLAVFVDLGLVLFKCPLSDWTLHEQPMCTLQAFVVVFGVVGHCSKMCALTHVGYGVEHDLSVISTVRKGNLIFLPLDQSGWVCVAS